MNKIIRMLKHMILQRKAALLLLFAAAFFGGQMTGMLQNRYETYQKDKKMKIPAAAMVMTAEQAVKHTSGENWGLSFQEEGKPPAANASAEELAKYDAFYAAEPDEKKIYLTFDCGYENGNTPAILDALKKHQVSATFFVVGNFVKDHPELIRRMLEEGHTVGNHTMHHPDMSRISDADSFRKEMQELSDLFKETAGQEISLYYRPPQGKYSEENLQMAKDLGYRTFFWSLAYVDWYEDKQPSREEAFQKLLGRIHPGAIVLLHNTSATNAAIMDELLMKWKEMGYTFGILEEVTAR